MRIIVGLTLATSTLLVAASARAHIALTAPAVRPTASIKDAPCGSTGSTRGDAISVFQPGETITVTWDETIDHPGYYRISFDADGQDFTIPPAINDTSASDNVLIDLIPDEAGGPNYSQQVTLPNIECETCTLQLIQLMTDKLPYTTDAASNDIYFQCADIALRSGGAPADARLADAAVSTSDGGPGADAGGGGGGGGGCTTGGAPGSAGILVAVGAVVSRMRRRTRR